MVSLSSPGYPGTYSVDQASLELRNPPGSASQVLGLKACATTAWRKMNFLYTEKEQSISILKKDFNEANHGPR